MQGNRTNPVSTSQTLFKPKPLCLLVASAVIIFAAEALVMMLIPALGLPANSWIGLVDATLLSLLVVPTLYFMFFKPMQKTIFKLDKSEEIQNRLEEIDQLKNDFISIVAHEMCTPVTAIMGYTDLLIDQTESRQHKEYLEVIRHKAQSIERIIDDLGIVNRLETGENLKIETGEHDLVKTVNQVCATYKLRFPDIPLRLDLPASPLMLRCDAMRISQVLDNLLSNAVKYSNSIHDEIEVAIINLEDQALIRVRDEGIGMSHDEVSKIYTKFFRAQTEKYVTGGLGLGMAIVKNIVDSHNGMIDIISQKKVGTTVTVALPKTAGCQQQE